ncbi:type I restriction endonuclease subunit R [Beggiatoa leptomitoformis]|uniref:Type I restriction enzyme endonuclease subunit n=1 Tax=Beggiatoa leptomitoformis TaxID=288004 RepID=A0A2N9YI66_9GAMM|nr:type I restriction endonuclease subunit R [Beggiatoa leptomitoformis]ALG67578.1 HsdR family type I site-specific deoxyribonuclease [Beggiatoa leptomitoformis]AUI70190.1 HsdR family type I site-specific deoxyribonuclease [Beggiatoa leptomitoformis]
MLEQDIEDLLIEKLNDLKYIYRADIRDRATLEQNFRQHFEALNHIQLTDKEFSRLLNQITLPDVFTAAKYLRERNSFERDDGTPLHYTLVNIKDWCKNTFEVVNQLRINTNNSYHRYDVILLINGVPVVQIELKTLAISPRRAIEQIIDYKNDIGNGYSKTLLCFIQLFIVSNRSDTWYFANNHHRHFSFNADERFLPIYQFANEHNQKITHLDSFAKEFLSKCTLGEMISRYMVLVNSEQKLLMMRPYQIYAVKAIVDCIHQHCGNGYIWHTTGSGKTLTSFKAATLLKDNPDIDKCLFVVDRKDLDRQTREEFNKFQEACVEENTNTAALVQRLLSDDYADKVIVTTIQKLGLALDDNSKHDNGKKKHNYKARLETQRNKRMVFIFDECHRSQFGENHKAIKAFFPNAQLFGFTGTPIFEENASYQQVEGQQASHKTTKDIFQNQLHAYTITHAIEDRNVLRFHIDYYKAEGENAPNADTIIAKQAIVDAIFTKHNTATNERKFNAILATASINDAIEYYELFKTLQTQAHSEHNDFQPLNIACIFSPPAEGNKDVKQLQDDLLQEKADNEQNPEEKKAALKIIIDDYNARYSTNHSINEFDLYYQDVQKRIKDQQYPNSDLPHTQKIDITIVVDMLLTGFDSKYLNTLYVDKKLKYHNLIQAFSRTNRILNDTKPYGNILDFRQQQTAVDTAIELFSGHTAKSAKEIWLVDDAATVITALEDAIRNLDNFMVSQGLENTPSAVPNLKGDVARSQFIKAFKEIQRVKTRLDQYTDLTAENKAYIEQMLPKDQLQGFKGVYLETAQQLRELQDKKGNTAPAEVQQLDFEFVLFASSIIDYDYIMSLIARYSQQPPDKQAMSREELINLIQSDAKFIDEREDIAEYIKTLETGNGLDVQNIRTGYEHFKAGKQTRQLMTIADKYGLELSSLQSFVDAVLRRMVFDSEQLNELFAPLGLGWKARGQKESALMDDLIPLLHKCAKGREISGLVVYEQ